MEFTESQKTTHAHEIETVADAFSSADESVKGLSDLPMWKFFKCTSGKDGAIDKLNVVCQICLSLKPGKKVQTLTRGITVKTAGHGSMISHFRQTHPQSYKEYVRLWQGEGNQS